MTDNHRDRPSPKDFDADVDRNGKAETARIVSGTPGDDATKQAPAEHLRRVGDPATGASARTNGSRSKAADDAIERATATLGTDEG